MPDYLEEKGFFWCVSVWVRQGSGGDGEDEEEDSGCGRPEGFGGGFDGHRSGFEL